MKLPFSTGLVISTPGCSELPAFPRQGWGGGVLPEKLGVGVRPAYQNRYPIYDQNLRFSYPIYDLNKNLIPYLWPDSEIIRWAAFVAGFI